MRPDFYQRQNYRQIPSGSLRRSVKKIIVGFIALVIIIGPFFVYCLYGLQPAGSASSLVQKFIIPKGETAISILNRLQEAKLIRSSLVSRLYLKITSFGTALRPGGYQISASLSTPDLLKIFMRGPQDVWITLPEGWRREQIAARLQANLDNFSPDLFIQLTATIEGRLFPDTYLIPASAAPADVVTLLTRNFSQKTGLDLTGSFDLTIDSRRLKLTGSQILILASLVEREAKNQSERENIAAILLKRLSLDWPLQVDASVQYARDTDNFKFQISNFKFWDPVTDTHYSSPYNTYLHPGLPPGPIANPGLAVISAVRNPQDTPYLFYLTGTDGVTHYAQNLSQHQLNIDKYLKL